MSFWIWKRPILKAQQLKRLSEHKYSCASSSLLDPQLQKWWNWLVSICPLYIAPNLITIVGLIVNILTTLVLVSYSPDGMSPPPRWACFLCALGLFIYQSLDAIDGKQARRTNSSSPLGELFDHGCDSLSTIFVALSACISCQLGHYPAWLFFQCFCAIVLFYCAHWQTYVSGTLRFGKIDVTEAQMTIIGIHMISAIFGPEIWLTKIFGKFELWTSMTLMTVVCGLWQMSFMCKVIKAGGIGRNGSSIAGTSVLSPSAPLAFLVIPSIMIACKSTQGIFINHPGLYIVAFGLVAAKITNKLVIAHMTKSEIDRLDWSLVGPGLLILNQYFDCIFPEIWLLWFTLFWAAADLYFYCQGVCYDICGHLKIDLFRIPYPPKSSTASQNTNKHGDQNGGSAASASNHQRKPVGSKRH
ncbi:hypothetical protein ACFFRR_009092 [Megaselia abdita]